MQRETSRRWFPIAYWAEGLLSSACVVYWLIVDPTKLTAWFWAMVVFAVAGAIGIIVLSLNERDHTDTLNSRADLDVSIRAKWK